MHPQANPIYQRHDFQNRRSASEPAHEIQAGKRLANTVSTEKATNNTNNSNESNHQHGDDCNYVDCLQKITTVKVRCLQRPKHKLNHIYSHLHNTTQTHG